MIEYIKNLFGFSRTFGAKRSPNWRIRRNEFVKENPRCAVCMTDKKLEVHHIVPVHIDSELELSRFNLITLCETHHFWFGHLGNWVAYNQGVLLDAKIWNEKIRNRGITV